MQDLILSFSDVALEFGEHRYGCYGRHILKHIFLPVFAEQGVVVLRNVRTQIGRDDGALTRVGDVAEHVGAIAIDGIVKQFSLAADGGEHHVAGSIQVFFVVEPIGVSFATICFASDGPFELFDKIIKRVGRTA